MRNQKMNTVDVINLVKSYSNVVAVDNLSFSLKPGEILGMIGPNGAGKSTTIKTILDFVKPDSGQVKVFDQEMSESIKDKIGYLPEERGLYRRLTAIELILYLASLKGIGRSQAEQRANELLALTGMDEYKNKKNKEMSKGMGQLIQFIVTVVHDPELIILDEPFSGLDPVRTEAVQKIISLLRENGKAIMLCTHQMNKVEELCDRVLMIDKGRTILYGDVMETRARFRKNAILVEVDGDLGELTGVIDRKIHNSSIELILETSTSPQVILDQLYAQGLTIHKFEVTTPTLNEIFLDLVEMNRE
jgi:ABC-2 type transport system ATP-binding protein